MLSLQDIYSSPVEYNGDVAHLQHEIGYVFRNFSKDTKQMSISLAIVKDAFYQGMQLHPDKVTKMDSIVGVATTSAAFGIPAGIAMSPSREDTRIAMIIGKPVAYEEDGQWHMGLEKRYAIALRVTHTTEVHVSKLCPVEPKLMKNAKTIPQSESITNEGRLVDGSSCGQRVCEYGNEVLSSIKKYTKAQVDKMVEDACHQFETLLSGIQDVVGEISPTTEHIVGLKRAHSVQVPIATRCDTMFVEEAVVGVKRVLGEASFEVKRIK